MADDLHTKPLDYAPPAPDISEPLERLELQIFFGHLIYGLIGGACAVYAARNSSFPPIEGVPAFLAFMVAGLVARGGFSFTTAHLRRRRTIDFRSPFWLTGVAPMFSGGVVWFFWWTYFAHWGTTIAEIFDLVPPWALILIGVIAPPLLIYIPSTRLLAQTCTDDPEQ